MKRVLKGIVAFAAIVSTVGLAGVTAPAASAAPASQPSAVRAASTPSPSGQTGKAKIPAKPPTTSAPANGARAKAGVSPKVGIGQTYLYNYNYCSWNEELNLVYNGSGSTAYFYYTFYNGSSSRTRYFSVAPYSYSYQYEYGVYGAYSTYLYSWNGSAYVSDEYKAGTNTCSVSSSAYCSSVYTGWVQVNSTNYGTAYATVQLRKLQPTPQETLYNYPSPGGYTSTNWFYVGTGKPWAVTTHTLNSSLTPQYFAATC